MGTYYDTNIYGNNLTEINTNIVNYLNNIEGISAELYDDIASDKTYYGFVIRYNDSNLEIFLGRSTDSFVITRSWVKNGDVYISGPYDTTGSIDGLNWCSLKIYVDGTFILFNACYISNRGGTPNGLGACNSAFITMENSDKLIGYYPGVSTKEIQDISTLIFENINDPARIQYSYANMFPYTANSGTLDFLAQSYFTNNGVRRYTTKLLKECSTVNLLSTVSLPDPLGNHLAIGEHCIVPITVEGGNS